MGYREAVNAEGVQKSLRGDAALRPARAGSGRSAPAANPARDPAAWGGRGPHHRVEGGAAAQVADVAPLPLPIDTHDDGFHAWLARPEIARQRAQRLLPELAVPPVRPEHVGELVDRVGWPLERLDL